MDKKPDMPENKKDEIDDILEIMHKRNTKIIISPPAKKEAASSGTESSKIKYSPDITPEIKADAAKINKAVLSDKATPGSTVTGDTVIIPSTVSDELRTEEELRNDSAPKESKLTGTAIKAPSDEAKEIRESVASPMRKEIGECTSTDATLTDIEAVKKYAEVPVRAFSGVDERISIPSEPTRTDMEPAIAAVPVKKEVPVTHIDGASDRSAEPVREASSGAVSLDDFNEEAIKSAAKGSKKKQKVKTSFLGSGWFGLIKVAIYLSCVILVSVLLAVSFIKIANDIFAFVKPSEIVTNIPDKADAEEIEKILKKNNLIKRHDENRIIVTVKPLDSITEKNTVENILKEREISEAIDVCGITVEDSYSDSEFTMKIPAGVATGAVAGILKDAGALNISCGDEHIDIDENASADEILTLLQENNILNKSSVTTMSIEIMPEISVSRGVSYILNRTDISEQLKLAGVTETNELSNTKFEVVFPEGTQTDIIAKFLCDVGARSITTDTEVTVVVKENATTDDIAQMLKDAGIIEYPEIFKIYANFRIEKRSYLTGKYRADEYKLNPMMNYDTLLDTLSDYERDVSGTVRVTIPEGLSVDETIDLLVKNGVGKKEDYYKALQEFEYDYRFAQELVPGKISEHRFNTDISYRLEGYLFPDTYDFYLNENPISVLDKMLSNFDRKFEEEYYTRCEKLGITVDEAITLASMIEKEGNNNKDFYMISLVFTNRLKDKSGRFNTLGSDATTQYALKEQSGDLYNINVDILHPYNTRNKYVYGLPPGPICNPSIEAINAALYPANLDNANDTNYYYFYTKKDGETVFSKTESAHNNVRLKDQQSN